jgi:RES domain-containing protein
VRLWRISDFSDLTGEGGRRVAARWNSAGHPIVYTSEHPAIALVENLAHIGVSPDDLPDAYQLLEIHATDDVASEAIDTTHLAGAKSDWRGDLAVTRELGDEWLTAGRTALLRVPSVILPKSTNVLLNPAHPNARRVKVVEITRPAYDWRLFQAQRR